MNRRGLRPVTNAANPNTDTQQQATTAPRSGDKPSRIWVSDVLRDTTVPQSFKQAEQTGMWRADILHTPGERKPYRVTLALRNHYARKFWTVEVTDCATEDEARALADALLVGRADALRRQARRHTAAKRRAGVR